MLKTLGAKRSVLVTILVAEYGILGLMSGLIGATFALMLSYAVSVYLLSIEWEANLDLLFAGVIATVLLVTAVGTAASFDVLFRKPLGTLRSQ